MTTKLRVVLDGPSTRLESALCTRCPQGVTGCCAAPPVIAWGDLGRIVTLGGRDWLLAELAASRLHPCPRGLAIERVANADVATTGRERKCVYHGATGCTVAHARRSATCNYYVCDEAFAEAGEERADTRRARALHARLTALWAEWDRVLGHRANARGVTWDAPFLDWLGDAYRLLAAREK